MTNQNHPLTPPPELLQLWWAQHSGYQKGLNEILIEAVQYGADQELEACCQQLEELQHGTCYLVTGDKLRAARRPEPQSLKKQALSEVAAAVAGGNITPERGTTIRLADACCEWLTLTQGQWELAADLRADRRPKPLSLAEEALKAYQTVSEFVIDDFSGTSQLESYNNDLTTIHRALERLQQLEDQQ